MIESRSASPEAQGPQISKPAGSPPSGGQNGSMGNSPSPAFDEKVIVGEVDSKYSSWRNLKRAMEAQWFVINAMVRGLQNVKWNDALGTLETRAIPTHKVRPAINKILPQMRARKAKYLRTRYSPIVVPASTDKEDALNAKASQMALEYASRKTSLESVYREVVDWVLTCGKAFIWLYWDDAALGLVKDPQTNKPVEIPVGDILYDVGNPFEVLVPDLGRRTIGEQYEIMRVRAVPVEELKLTYSSVPNIQDIKGDTNTSDLFQYQKQIATLSAKTNVGLVSALADKSAKDLQMVVRKELFTRPCAKYPQGRYVVVAGGRVLKYQEVLPYGFASQKNPFPVVEFSDIELPGQFWPTSIAEQLIGPQKEYNDYRAKIVNHLNKQAHPKVIVSVYSKWPENSWNDEAGEVIRILTPPGIMEPKIVVPPPLSQDLWNGLRTVSEEMMEIASSSPVNMGQAGQTTSGFQVNQLQEANDAIQASDIRGHEIAFEELYRKSRKIMAQGYTQPRLVSITGRSHIPDVQEFSSDNIDENAEIIVYTGSSLANSPAVRTQQVIELWQSGILQDQQNPSEARRRALTMLDANGIGEFQEEQRRDEEKARLENLNMSRGGMVNPPLPFDNHQIHYTQHTDQMKSPEFDLWPEQEKKELFAHTIFHMKFINPQLAMTVAAELGIYEVIPMLQPPQIPPQYQPQVMAQQAGQPGQATQQQQQQHTPQQGQPANAGPVQPQR